MSKENVLNIKKTIFDIIEANAPATSQEIIFAVRKQSIYYKNEFELMEKITDTLNDLIREKKVWVTVYDDYVAFE